MGTSRDGISVLLPALWFPVFELVWVSICNRKGHFQPALTPLYFLSWFFAGLFIGIGSTFGWNALRWPLISLLVGSAAGIVVCVMLAKRKLRSGPNVIPPTASG
jgi:hypothetical protein